MTNDNDLIRRGDVLNLLPYDGDGDPSGTFDHKIFVKLEAIAAIPAFAASQPSALETCGRCMGSGYGGHPDNGALCIDCNGSGGVAASQPADPVTNADSRQRVMVKPLVWEEVNPGVFVAESSLGVWSRFDGHYMRPDASGGIASDNPEAAAQADYAARIMSAIDVHPDPRDAQIAALVEAAKALEMWDAARGYPVPYRVRDPLRAALAAVKGDNRE